MIWFGWVLWHISHCRLFKTKSSESKQTPIVLLHLLLERHEPPYPPSYRLNTLCLKIDATH